RSFTASALPHEAPTKPLDSIEAFLDVGHAGGVAEADVIVGAEGDAGHGSDLFLLQQFGAEVPGLQTGVGDVGEEIECALRVHAGNAGNAVEFPPGIGAAI